MERVQINSSIRMACWDSERLFVNNVYFEGNFEANANTNMYTALTAKMTNRIKSIMAIKVIKR